MIERTVLLTGATGNMGIEVLKLLTLDKRIKVRVLSLPDKISRKKLSCFMDRDDVDIIWGDLTRYEDVLKAVEGSDYILHMGAVIPPAADYYQVLAEKVNYGGTLNIIQAVKAQKDHDSIRLIYIGSVAETGSRLPPKHWVRVGDPIQVSKFDNYGITKVKAERAVAESGLKYWVSLRQTAMLHYNIMNSMDPIIFHQPLNTHVEWVTAEDTGRLLYNLCTFDLPDSFYRNIYNIGGGKRFRKTYGNFIDTVYKILGVVNFRKLYNPGWFALKNFHCSWFRDSDILENYLHFRQQSFTDYLDKLKRKIPSSIKIIRYIPARIIKRFLMKPLAGGANGPFGWIKRGELEKIEAFYGSVEKWEQGYKNWNDLDFDPVVDENLEGSEIDHGWQEGKDQALIDGNDMREAAFFRGGKCLSSDMKKGDLFTPLKWECSQGHIFTATPFIVLKGGHWCPECDIDPFTYGKSANKDKLLAQVL